MAVPSGSWKERTSPNVMGGGGGGHTAAEASVMCKALLAALTNPGEQTEALGVGLLWTTANRREKRTDHINSNYMVSDTSSTMPMGIMGPHPSREPDAPQCPGTEEKAH